MRYIKHGQPILTCGRCEGKVCSAIISQSGVSDEPKAPWPWYVLCDQCYSKWVTGQFEPWERGYNHLRKGLELLKTQGQAGIAQCIKDLEEAGEYENVYIRRGGGLDLGGGSGSDGAD